MATLDPYENLDEALDIKLYAPDYDQEVKATWTYPQEDFNETRRSLKRKLQYNDDEDEHQLDGVAWYIKDQTP